MHGSSARARRLRLAVLAAAGLVAVLGVIALLILSYGWTRLRHPLEQRLTAQFGRRVTIGSLRRIDHGFLTATLAIDDARIAQPDWAGGGDFVRIAHATLTLPILPLLHGAIRPQSLAIDGLEIAMLRRDGAHANWKGLPGGGKAKRGGPGLQHLSITHGRLRFDDFKRRHFFTATLAADDRGLRVAGSGTLIGRPMLIRLAGPGLLGNTKWPFRLDYRSPVANFVLQGLADKPLDIGHFDAHVRAWGDDLKHLDLLVEAGLPGTAAVRALDVQVRHDRPDWLIRSIKGTIGRSHFAGSVDVRQRAGRTILTGAIVADALDFDDLANAEGKARGAARRAAAPGRKLPDTRIDLAKLSTIDGTMDLDIRRLVFRQPSAFRSIRTHLEMSGGVLTAKPFVVGLQSGRLGGMMRVTQKGDDTRLALDLRLADSRIEAMASDAGAFSGALAGRFVLDGPGKTIRAAIGAADGRFALVGSNGTLGRQTALLIGQDIGRGVFAGKEEVARLRCGVGSFVVHGGKARPAPLLIDTSVARAEATGTIDLTDERIDLSLTGQPKQKSVLRLSGPIRVTGRLFAPTVAAPEATSRAGILKSLGRAINGGGQPLAADADCAGLAARALR